MASYMWIPYYSEHLKHLIHYVIPVLNDSNEKLVPCTSSKAVTSTISM